MQAKDNRARRRPGTLSPTIIFSGIFLIAFAVAGGSLTVVQAAAPDAVATQEELYKKGKSSYRKRCARCHGPNMGTPGVGVYDLREFPLDDEARFVDSVANGKNAMPSWGDVLKPVDIQALWTYVSEESKARQ